MFQFGKKVTNAHDEGIWCVKWQGDIIATGGMGPKVKSWHGVSTPDFLKERKVFDKHILGVTSLDIDVSNKYLATGGLDGTIRIFDLNTNTLYKSLDSGPLGCLKIGFLNNADRLVSVSESGNITIYSTESGEKLKTISNQNKQILTMAISPNNEQIIVGGLDGVVSCYEVESGRRITEIKAHGVPVRSLSFSSDSKTIFTGGEDSQIRLHDPNSSTPYIASLMGHSSFILSLAASRDGNLLASSGSIDKKVCIWDIKTRKLDSTFTAHADHVWDLAWSPDSTKLVSVSDDGSLHSYALKQ
ncbi:hypothetical protein DICPUDRAFT_83630 [Dictyostelium purpureum]|uniref:Uncharacterized protein n=1 Tax=Dictyostelium purpureum TaxID=5786 RepID=F1A045_DICPU|nr:uncharacterized protein DICPUDRAFT_83630 [Dictyostelium purpureum]EGC30441.1 hypothetical protein DICPUDRAFT_83630 [Dictyostelium purpureum]|eukprot:XP_003293041.1 hypothetical protein DICPUDRAFT_83630 [Dictyostelium purpureum]